MNPRPMVCGAPAASPGDKGRGDRTVCGPPEALGQAKARGGRPERARAKGRGAPDQSQQSADPTVNRNSPSTYCWVRWQTAGCALSSWSDGEVSTQHRAGNPGASTAATERGRGDPVGTPRPRPLSSASTPCCCPRREGICSRLIVAIAVLLVEQAVERARVRPSSCGRKRKDKSSRNTNRDLTGVVQPRSFSPFHHLPPSGSQSRS